MTVSQAATDLPDKWTEPTYLFGRPLKNCARKIEIHEPIQRPVGAQSFSAEDFVSFLQKFLLIINASRLDEGRVAIVTNVRRDAMDGSHSQTCDVDADGEVVWSWRPLAGAKPAGDDLQATVTKRSWTPGSNCIGVDQ
jgi:hypothetical protein